MINASDLADNLKAFTLIASPDPTRPHLNSIRIEFPSNSVVRFVATNGHVLLVNEAHYSGGSDLAPFMISVADAKKLLQFLDKKTRAPQVAIYDGEFAQGGRTFGFSPVKATFPPYQQVIPSYTPPEDPPETPAILATTMDPVMRALAILDAGFAIHPGPTAMDPILLVSNKSALAVVMPARSDIPSPVALLERYKSSELSHAAAE